MPPEVINILKVFLFNRLTHWYSDGYILHSHQEGFQNFRFQFIFHRVIHARKIFIIYYIINYLYGWFLRFQTNWNLKSETLPTCCGRGFSGFEGKHRDVQKKMQNRSKKNAGILDNRLCKVVYLQCWEWLFSPQRTRSCTEFLIIRCCHPEER